MSPSLLMCSGVNSSCIRPLVQMNETDHERSATLEEVLAFIDACEADKSASTSEAVKPRKYRSQVGHEVKRLRREAKYLVMRLKQLMGGSTDDSEALHALQIDAGQSRRMQTELEEYRRYRQSKRTNRQLQALVAQQSQVSDVFQSPHLGLRDSDLPLCASTIANRATSSEMAANDGCPEQRNGGLADRGFASRPSEQARARLGQRPGPRRARSSRLAIASVAEQNRPRHDFRVGTSVLLPCALQLGACGLLPLDPIPPESGNDSGQQGELRYVVISLSLLCSDWSLDCYQDSGQSTKIVRFDYDKQLHELHGRNSIHRIEQADRVVYLQSALYTIPQEQLSFVEDCAHMIRRYASTHSSVTEPGSESLFLSWHRISVVRHGTGAQSALPALAERVVSHENARVQSHFLSIKRRIQEI